MRAKAEPVRGQDEYEVETIVDKKEGMRGEVLYLIKWKGFEKPTDRTWEPSTNLFEVQHLIDDYERRAAGRGKKAGKTMMQEMEQQVKKHEEELEEEEEEAMEEEVQAIQIQSTPEQARRQTRRETKAKKSEPEELSHPKKRGRPKGSKTKEQSASVSKKPQKIKKAKSSSESEQEEEEASEEIRPIGTRRRKNNQGEVVQRVSQTRKEPPKKAEARAEGKVRVNQPAKRDKEALNTPHKHGRILGYFVENDELMFRVSLENKATSHLNGVAVKSYDELKEDDPSKLQTYMENYLEGFMKEKQEETKPPTTEQRGSIEFWSQVE